MGKRMRILPSMNAFERQPLHQRTIDNWAAAVMGVDDLAAKIASELRVWLRADWNDGAVRLMAEKPDMVGFLIETICDASLVRSVSMEYVMDSHWELNGTIRNDLFLISLTGVNATWENQHGLKLMMLLCTYRALCQRRAGFIPGLAGNITIAGAVFTAMKLGVPIAED